VLLEDPDIQGRIRSDPRTFLEELRPPVLFDEIQNAPELLSYVRTLIDAAPRRMGQWLFAGSQEAPLMQGITESMAGRAAILQLLPFSIVETAKVNMLHGGFPEVLARPKSRALWFASYLQIYLERDVRAITNVRDLVTFRRFLALLASRHGQTLNKTDLCCSARRFCANYKRVVARSRNHEPNRRYSPVLRKSWQTARQNPESLLG
jgi:predicted AAA+ superfamily ATPase